MQPGVLRCDTLRVLAVDRLGLAVHTEADRVDLLTGQLGMRGTELLVRGGCTLRDFAFDTLSFSTLERLERRGHLIDTRVLDDGRWFGLLGPRIDLGGRGGGGGGLRREELRRVERALQHRVDRVLVRLRETVQVIPRLDHVHERAVTLLRGGIREQGVDVRVVVIILGGSGRNGWGEVTGLSLRLRIDDDEPLAVVVGIRRAGRCRQARLEVRWFCRRVRSRVRGRGLGRGRGDSPRPRGPLPLSRVPLGGRTGNRE